MTRPFRPISRIALALLALAFAGALVGCNQPPALSKVELDTGKLSKEHPEVDPKIANDCRKCHREQPAIRKK